MPRKWLTLRALAGDSTITNLPIFLPLTLFTDAVFVFELARRWDMTLVEARLMLFVVFAASFLLVFFAWVLMAGFGRPSWAGVAPMRNRVVPHAVHLPRVPGAPLLVKVGCASIIARLVLHLTQ
ncbi:MAG: hypothetical protein SNJ59_00925 [Aggregatilineales bacterium]